MNAAPGQNVDMMRAEMSFYADMFNKYVRPASASQTRSRPMEAPRAMLTPLPCVGAATG